MKINGQKFSNNDHVVGPFPVERNVPGEVDVIDPITMEPTGEKEAGTVSQIFGIYCQPIWDYDEFDELYPRPKPPITGWSPKGVKTKGDVRDPQFKKELEEYAEAREGWSIMESLKPSEIELDGVDMDNPKDWPKIKPALKKMFSWFEYNAIIALMDEACGIDEDKVEVNRQTFLSRQKATNTLTSP